MFIGRRIPKLVVAVLACSFLFELRVGLTVLQAHALALQIRIGSDQSVFVEFDEHSFNRLLVVCLLLVVLEPVKVFRLVDWLLPSMLKLLVPGLFD